MKISCFNGDITKIKTEIVVNAANSSLLGGSGVDGAIHKAGGPSILEQCIQIRNRQGKCKTGEAVITTAGNMPAKYVIHTVGPVWYKGNNEEKELLSKCYYNSLILARTKNARSIAFPNISTGIYKFPKDEAARIALSTVKKNLLVDEIVFVCYDDENYRIYNQLLTQ